MPKLKNKIILPVLAAVAVLIAALAYFVRVDTDSSVSSSSRWYTAAQASAGHGVYMENCLACHGKEGRSTAQWRKRLPDGSFPPPPLNGSAHTWHHPLAQLKSTIKQGGAQYGGKMPAFESVLSNEEIEQVIAYFQSQWPEEVYQVWDKQINNR